MNIMKRLFIIFSFLFISSCAHIGTQQKEPFADMHLHFNWDQEELLSAKEAVAILDKHNVVLAAVSSVPSSYALKLAKAGGEDWIIPFFSPYYHAGNRLDWFYDKQVLVETRKGLAAGQDYVI